MSKADAALNILRNRIHNFENYGGMKEKEVGDKLKVIEDAKRKIVDSMMSKRDKCAGGHSKAYEVPIKSKLGKFSVEWYSYNTTQTPEEKKLNAVYKQLRDERHATGKLLRRKLDDITLKINISGLDGDTTQLLKDFLAELERIEG
jgi:hypothetical protein